MNRDEFAEWIVKGMRESTGDLAKFRAYVREGAPRIGRVPRDLFQLLPVGVVTEFTKAVR